MSRQLHSDEFPIGIDLVRRLVASQYPQYAQLPLKALDAFGSSNVHYLLGDDLLIRLPRQPGGGESILKEHRWVPLVGAHLPVAVPEFVVLGEPAPEYREVWAIMRWQDGEHPSVAMSDDPGQPERTRLALELAELVASFRGIEVTPEARAERQLRRPYRGQPLAQHDRQMRRNVAACRSIDELDLDLDAVLDIWTRALALPGAADPPETPRWFHGDIVAENLLLNDGRLTGLLDFGGLGIGDPAVDLHGAWEMLDVAARTEFQHRMNIDEAQWLRGRAWALAIAVMTFPYYWATMPERCRSRLAMARAVLADAG